MKKKFYHHCDNCDFAFLDPLYLPDSQKEKARYDIHENNTDNESYLEIFKNFISYAIEPYLPNKILDYGSGPEPVLAKLLEEEKYLVETYDPFYSPQKPDSKFDLISSTEVFEHFHNPLKDIEKIITYMEPGAYLAIMTRFIPSFEEFKTWNYKDDTTHVSFFSPKTFETITEIFNFKILKHNNLDTIILKNLN